MINVTAIKLPEDFDTYKNIKNEKAEFLEPISKINIFVGSNNSGKSRFMRKISFQTCYNVKVADFNIETTNAALLEIIKSLEDLFDRYCVRSINQINRNDLSTMCESLTDSISVCTDRYQNMRNNFQEWKKIFEVTSHTENNERLLEAISNQTKQSRFTDKEKEEFPPIIKSKSLDALKILNKIPVNSESTKPKKVYIPTLRGLRPLDDDHSDFYFQQTIRDYFTLPINAPKNNFESEQSQPEIFTGLSLYKRITDLLLGNNKERKLIYEYQNFISEKLFENQSVALIPNQRGKVVIVKIGDEKEQPIHHLGDGIQSAIILSFLPFVMQEQTFFFIEEPEMYLHPGLQRKILGFYNSLERHTFFLTTHSNHFLDITIDIKDVSIFTFRKILDDSESDEKEPNFTIEAVDSGCESSLELLGVRNSSVFLVNATIWVEGITDRWYFRKMLESYMEYLAEKGELKLRLEEDTHYSFVEYGGANITHWSFLDYEEHPIEVERLCAKAVVIIDGDGEKKMKRKEDLERILEDRLIILPCREVENLLPYEVIKQVVLEYENDADLNIKDFEYDQYKDVYLGKFIEEKMLKRNPQRKGGYKSDSGTIKSKVDFCEKAIQKIEYIDLSETVKTEIQKIYDFIHSQNS